MLIFQTFGIVFLRPKTADSKTNEILWRGIPWHFCNSKAQNFLMRRSSNKKDVYATSGDTQKEGKKGEKNPIVHSFFLLIIILQVLNTQTLLLLVGTMTVTSVSLPDCSLETKAKEECFGILTQLFVGSHSIPILFMCLLQIWQTLVGKGFINYSFFSIQTSSGGEFEAPRAILSLYRFTFSVLILKFICAIDLKTL